MADDKKTVEEVVETPEEEVHLDLDKPEEASVEEEAKIEEVVEETPSEEDRSAFNCTNCKGEGIVNSTTLCPQCLGTGKV